KRSDVQGRARSGTGSQRATKNPPRRTGAVVQEFGAEQRAWIGEENRRRLSEDENAPALKHTSLRPTDVTRRMKGLGYNGSLSGFSDYDDGKLDVKRKTLPAIPAERFCRTAGRERKPADGLASLWEYLVGRHDSGSAHCSFSVDSRKPAHQ